jgi:hypothetical protein
MYDLGGLVEKAPMILIKAPKRPRMGGRALAVEGQGWKMRRWEWKE